MAKDKTLIALFAVIGLLVGVLATFYVMPAKVTTKEIPVITEKVVEVPGATDLTEVNARLDAINLIVSEDENWETEAFALATEEWSHNGYRAIFKELSNIEDKEDISSVEVTDTEVISSDAEDKDAVVWQKVKVKYEDSDGDHAKTYFEITTEIKDGEVEDQEID
jgi:hypothetical protein